MRATHCLTIRWQTHLFVSMECLPDLNAAASGKCPRGKYIPRIDGVLVGHIEYYNHTFEAGPKEVDAGNIAPKGLQRKTMACMVTQAAVLKSVDLCPPFRLTMNTIHPRRVPSKVPLPTPVL